MLSDESLIEETVQGIQPLDARAVRAARERQDALLKPARSLGELEELSIQIAGITGQEKNVLTRKVHFLFGADHGVFDEGVSGSPQYFTRVLMELYAKGAVNPDAPQQCGINVLCRSAGVELRVFDLGVKGLAPCPGLDSSHKLMPEGTGNFARGRAMPPEIARSAIALGIRLVRGAKEKGYQIVGAGEVGMGNTTPAAACIMAVLNTEDPALVGRGGGLTDAAYTKKQSVIVDALRRHHLVGGEAESANPIEILSCVGGLEIAAMTGVFLGGAACCLPVVVDGVISVAAALLAARLAPLSREYMIASHRSAEPAYSKAADALGLRPFLDLGMRLGEGSGCPLAMRILDDALALMNGMGTFAEVSLESDYREALRI